jgi:pimeloyl-ACP methyl ester carboxylesterase
VPCGVGSGPTLPGVAPPVVLVHGLASSFEHNWRQPGWVDLLADAGREVIPVDLLGHGTAPSPHDPAAYADLGARVREALPTDRAVDAVGFSLGARVLLEAAAQAPQEFRRLVVGGVGANLLTEPDYEPLARALESGDVGAPGGLGLFVRFAAGSGDDPRALAALLRHPRPALSADQLRGVTCPVLVVLGDRDFAGPAGPLVDALPDGRMRILRGVDHFATPRDVGFIDAALRFLDAVPR